MKRGMVVMLAFAIAISITFFTSHSKQNEIEIKQMLGRGYLQTEDSNRELYHDVLISLLSPYTQKEVSRFYSDYLKETPGSDPNLDTIVSVKKLDNERLAFLIKVETFPYIGSHNAVGCDHITFKVNALGEVTLHKYKHIESSNIVPQLYPNIIKKWPPS